MGAIEGDSYREEQRMLKEDPIIQAMAREIVRDYADIRDFLDSSTHDGTAPMFGFMGAASDEYRRRGPDPDHGRTIGGPARAVIALVREYSGVQSS